jgi:predicted permease
MVDAVVRDIRFAARALIRNRVFTVVAVLTFAIGIGMNVAAFSVLDRVLFRPLPYGSPEDLVLVRQCGADGECAGTIPSLIAYEGQRLASVEGFACAGFASSYSLTREPDDTPPLRFIGVTQNVLRVLRVSPARGRDFTDEDVSSKRAVALISHESWQNRFGGSEDAVGKDVWSRTGPTTIVGILPAGFIPPAANAHDPAWEGLVLATDWVEISPTGRIMPPTARLRPGVTLEQARSEIAALVAALEPQLRVPGQSAPIVIRVDPLQKTLFARFRSNFLLIVGTTSLLLLLACANLSTLLLSFGRTREREAAITAALGAGRVRLLGQALWTACLVCLAGSTVALAAVFGSSRALAVSLPPLIARYATDVTDRRVLVVSLLLAFASTVVAGMVPALRTGRVDLLRVLQRTPQSGRHSRLRGGSSLLAVETAIGVLLVLGALLILRSFSRLAADDLGFTPDGLYTVAFPLRGATPEQHLALYRQSLEALATVPGIGAVGGADSPAGTPNAPMRGFSNDRNVRGARFEISAEYFDAIGAPLLAGRAFTGAEVRGRARVAVLSRAGARMIWPQLPLDRIIGLTLALPGEAPFRVVGVVPDLKRSYGQDAVEPALYVPLGTGLSRFGGASIRVEPGSAIELAVLRQRLRELLGPVAVTLTPATTVLEPGLQDPRLRAIILVTLAFAALALAATGLYAVAAFDVRERQYEMGVRLSFGATARDIQRMVVAQACRPVAAGIVVGLAAAYASVTLLQQFLYQVEPRDPWLYATVAAILIATGVVAAWLPAWRAGRLDPSVVLRAQ